MIVLCSLFSSGFTSEHIKQCWSGQSSSHTDESGKATDLLLILDRTRDRLDRWIGVSELMTAVEKGVLAGVLTVLRRIFKLDLKLREDTSFCFFGAGTGRRSVRRFMLTSLRQEGADIVLLVKL